MRKPRILMVNESSFLSTGFGTYGFNILNYLYNTNKYEIASLESYVHDNDPRHLQLPWTVYGSLPNNDVEKQIFNREPQLNQFGKWKFTDVVLDFKPDHVCLPPGSLVLTDHGYKKIETIQIGDKVLTHKNRFKKVLKTMKREYNGYNIALTLNSHQHIFKCTEDHPILVYKKRSKTTKKPKIRDLYKEIQPEFIPAKEIRPGDLVVLPKNNEVKLNQIIDISSYLVNYRTENNLIYCRHNAKSKPIPKFIELNKDLARLLGYIYGDGCISRSGFNITFSGDEESFAKDSIEITKHIFGLDGTIQRGKETDTWIVNFNSVLMAEFLYNLLGLKSNIIKEIWYAEIPIKLEFLSGLVRSDGCYKKDGRVISVCTILRSLAEDIKALWASCNYGATLTTSYKSDINPNHADAHEVSVSSVEHTAQLHDIINKYPRNTKLKLDKSSKSAQLCHYVNDHIVFSVNRVRLEDYVGQVYNLEVEDDNSYVSSICVHNCLIRDPWFDSWVNQHPYRRFLNVIWMPTVDSEPMRPEWIDDLKQCNRLLTYTDYGKRVLESQTGGKLQVFGVPSAGVETEIFKPIPNKAEAKDALDMESDTIVFGTVMRSQPRKFYPELFKSFVKYLDICRANGREDLANKSYLYVHAGLVDVGWDLKLEIKRHKLSHKVLFTYHCRQCKFTRPLFYSGEICFCPQCQNPSMSTPGSAHGITRQELAKIINTFDIYLQVASNEGLGMPILEAKACGVPAAVIDYSAMSDLAHEPGGIPVKVATIFQEPLNSTYQLRAYPDNDDLADKMFMLAKMSNEERQKIGMEGRQWIEKRYNWNHVGKIWENCIDSLPIKDINKTWLSAPNILQGKFNIPNNLSNEEFIAYLWLNVVKDPSKLNHPLTRKCINSLNLGYEIASNGEGSIGTQEVNRETVIKWFTNYINQHNAAEMYRYNKLLNKQRSTLHVAEV